MTRGIIKPFTHSLESLQETLDELRSNNKSIGLCHGCFDLIHDGHIQHLKEVSRLSDYLVVSITNDVNIKKVQEGQSTMSQKEQIYYQKK